MWRGALLLWLVTTAWAPQEGADFLGRTAPAWSGIEWIQGGPLSLASLRGRVVLLRFWTVDCPYCTTTAPALRALHDRYRARGLAVVAIHHPKSDSARDPETVRRAARALRLTFPIGHDERWETLAAYGVGTRFRRFTSVSVLIDRAGVVRFVHDGGELHEDGGPGHEICARAHAALVRAIEEALTAERKRSGARARREPGSESGFAVSGPGKERRSAS